MLNKKKLLVISLAVPAILIAVVVISALIVRWHGRHFIEQFKQDSITKIEELTKTEDWIDAEVKKYRDVMSPEDWNEHIAKNLITEKELPVFHNCLDKNLILMRNGEWIVYCYWTYGHKFPQAFYPQHDLFIGKASDGKWYTTDSHFCINMLILRFGPWGDLNTFKQEYSLVELLENNN